MIICKDRHAYRWISLLAATCLGVLLVAARPLQAQYTEVAAYDDYASTGYGQSVIFNILENDFCYPGDIDPASIVMIDEPVGGAVVIDYTNGDVVYYPDTTYWGFDCFSYEYSDSTGYVSNVAYVSIDIAQPQLPNAQYDSFDVPYGQTIALDVLANDSGYEAPLDPSSIVITAEPLYGDFSIDVITGVVSYTPNDEGEQWDMFCYTVADAYGNVSEETTVDLWKMNESPVIEFFDAVFVGSNMWRFSGTVTDDQSTAGLNILFGGAITGYDTTAYEDGYFELVVSFLFPPTGAASAVARDGLGQESEMAFFDF